MIKVSVKHREGDPLIRREALRKVQNKSDTGHYASLVVGGGGGGCRPQCIKLLCHENEQTNVGNHLNIF
jgi:hypothetical protein